MDKFVAKLQEGATSKIILTGTRTDPQLYKFEDKLLAYLRKHVPGSHISLHTNGLLAVKKLKTFNQYDTATISLNSFDREVYRVIHGTRIMPDLAFLLANSSVPIKLSCVITNENVQHVEQYLQACQRLGIQRVAFRHVFNQVPLHVPFFNNRTPTSQHCGNPVFDVDGIQVTYWVFENTTGASLNLFADGTLSEQYLLSKAPNAAGSAS